MCDCNFCHYKCFILKVYIFYFVAKMDFHIVCKCVCVYVYVVLGLEPCLMFFYYNWCHHSSWALLPRQQGRVGVAGQSSPHQHQCRNNGCFWLSEQHISHIQYFSSKVLLLTLARAFQSFSWIPLKRRQITPVWERFPADSKKKRGEYLLCVSDVNIFSYVTGGGNHPRMSQLSFL